jgi:hypothetical protein
MKGCTVGLSLGLMLAVGGVSYANTAMIDFTGSAPVASGLKQVNSEASKDGAITIVQRGGKNVAQTGNKDADHYLYLALDSAFKQNVKSVWVTVEYFDEGTGTFSLQFDGVDDPATTASGPSPRTKFDSKQFRKQTWHLVGPKLAGGMTGGADVRVDDATDDPEFIASISVSDVDPNFIHFPYAVNKITIDGKADAAEWDGAFQVKLDHPQLDGVGGSPNWVSAKDFSGTYSFKYDETAFYILGQVTDATPRLNTVDDGQSYWNGDGTEQFLGLDETDVERTSCTEGTDFQVGTGVGKTPGWAILAPTGMSLDPIEKNIAITNTADGYTFELQIPWAKLNSSKVTQGQKIAWYMFANDSHDDPSAQQIALGPLGATGASWNPLVWIRAMHDAKP